MLRASSSIRRRGTRRTRLFSVATATALALPLVLAGPARSAAAADCGTDGIRWAESPADVRGLAFTGTVIGVVQDTPEPGMRSLRVAVDEALDGAIGDELVLTPWCVATPFRTGERYLVGTSDRLPVPGNEPTPGDGQAWFTDGYAVAWRIGDGDRVTLLGYGDGSLADAPGWLRAPTTLRAAIRALLPSGGDADPLPPASPAPSPTDPPGVTREALGATQPEALSDTRLEFARMVLDPGVSLPPTRYSGSWLARVESGTLAVSLRDGTAWIQGFEGSEDNPIEAGEARMLGEGQLLSFGPDAVLAFGNAGSDPVSVLTTAIVDADDPSTTVVADPGTTPSPSSPVVRRFVLAGRGLTGDRYRITVLDRSGRVIGARVPTEQELRFAGGGDPPRDYRDIGIGPVAYLDGNVRELLIWWTGTPCGPVATVDVARAISAIRVVDRTGGCDAAGVPYRLVLRLRGDPPDPNDIEGSWTRGR